jgi:hypothetical protein
LKFSVVVVKGQAGHQSMIAQLKTVLLCRFLGAKDRAVDPMTAVFIVMSGF